MLTVSEAKSEPAVESTFISVNNVNADTDDGSDKSIYDPTAASNLLWKKTEYYTRFDDSLTYSKDSDIKSDTGD
ncbi:hypothetical protein Bpfe_008228 [Biomphalaria pfeifferi]|uniref:Uncharacterized protein n=1 Tax=Biomphalaria pfeifferi TaxID=112525 RepID=A0AAD8BYS2_BIOPF|nr:hypothetical protein Bpfe_008228 [Biomphalaria pfeifferi]